MGEKSMITTFVLFYLRLHCIRGERVVYLFLKQISRQDIAEACIEGLGPTSTEFEPNANSDVFGIINHLYKENITGDFWIKSNFNESEPVLSNAFSWISETVNPILWFRSGGIIYEPDKDSEQCTVLRDYYGSLYSEYNVHLVGTKDCTTDTAGYICSLPVETTTAPPTSSTTTRILNITTTQILTTNSSVNDSETSISTEANLGTGYSTAEPKTITLITGPTKEPSTGDLGTSTSTNNLDFQNTTREQENTTITVSDSETTVTSNPKELGTTDATSETTDSSSKTSTTTNTRETSSPVSTETSTSKEFEKTDSTISSTYSTETTTTIHRETSPITVSVQTESSTSTETETITTSNPHLVSTGATTSRELETTTTSIHEPILTDTTTSKEATSLTNKQETELTTTTTATTTTKKETKTSAVTKSDPALSTTQEPETTTSLPVADTEVSTIKQEVTTFDFNSKTSISTHKEVKPTTSVTDSLPITTIATTSPPVTNTESEKSITNTTETGTNQDVNLNTTIISNINAHAQNSTANTTETITNLETNTSTTAFPINTSDINLTPTQIIPATLPSRTIRQLETVPVEVCPCKCPEKLNTTFTQTSTKKLTTQIQRNLTVNTQQLSKTTRQKASASDDRPSSLVGGVIAILLMTFIFGSLLFLDAVDIVRHLLVFCRQAGIK